MCDEALGEATRRLSIPRPADGRRRRPGLALVLILIIVGFLATGSLEAQDTGTPLGPVDRTSLDFLLTLPDDQVMVRYTPGSLDRAARLQYRLKALYEQLDKWSPVGSPFSAFVLSPEEWHVQGILRPYGLPARVAVFGGAAPAWGNPETVALWRGLAGVSLDSGGEFTVRGSAEELATVLLADALLEIEMCRMVALNLGLAPVGGDPWVADLVAHVLCASARHQAKEPSPVNLAAALRRLRQSPGAIASPRLGEFTDDLEPALWLAYQARFAEGGERVWMAEGKGGVKDLVKRWRRKGAPLVFADLVALFPTLAEWRAQDFASG